MEHQVFISYSTDKGDSTESKDRQVADMICTGLESKGIRCWIAHRDILPGGNWLNTMIDAVEKSKILVLVFSANTNKSSWVVQEVTRALRKDLRIIPFRIEDVSPMKGLRVLEDWCQWMDAYTPPLENHLDKLIEAVCSHLGIEPEKPVKIIEEAPEAIKDPVKIEEKRKEKKPLHWKWILFPVAFIVLIALVFIFKDYGINEIQKDVKAVESKGFKVLRNEKGCWEAYHEEYDITMIYIEAGKFTMGSNDYDREKPPHQLHLDGYWMGKYEVTFDQYDKYCQEDNQDKPDDKDWGRGKRPVINISWYDAYAYCDWLSKFTQHSRTDC